jgi:hypothetical protein
MIELLGGGVLGGVLGLLGRLAPEVMKFLDQKNERAHELAMFDRQCELEKVRGQIKLEEIGAQRDLGLDVGAMTAFGEAIKQQTEMVKVAGGWVASLSASVRPVLTYSLLVLYACSRYSAGWVFTPDDMALFSGVVNYFFLNRTFEKRNLS